jgi:putative ABC transport system permease protein
MRWRSRWLSKDRELDEEILAHLDIEVTQRIEAGETRVEAERAARRQFGSVALVMEVTRSMWGYAWLESLAQDVKYGVRTLRKAPGFTAAAILTLALGIGASTAAFSVVNGILLRPLPYPEADRIAVLWRLAPPSAAFGGDEFPWGRFDFSLFQEQARTFESLGAFQSETFNLTGLGEPVFLEGMRASAGFFPALGVAPAIGRLYTAEEDRVGHEHCVVLSDRLWRERFGADRTIPGRTIDLNGFGYTVIGVMPPGFSFPHAEEMPTILEFPREAQLWVPLAIAPGERGASELAVVGRMRRHITIAQAQAELDVFGHTFERLFPAAKAWSKSRAVPLRRQIVGDTRRPLLLLLGAVGFVLLIASSNVAGLVLTRSLGRRREFELRAALGAGSGRVIRQLLTESLLLAAAGGILGIGLAEAGILLVKSFGPANLPRLQEVSLDPVVVAFGAGITLLAGLLFGLAPAIGVGREKLANSIKAGLRIAGSQLSPMLRNALSIGQVALALVLVVAAGLLVRTFYGLLGSDGGFKVERVLTFEISLPPAKYPDPDRMAQLYSRALETLRKMPGVESAGLVHAVPMGGEPDATVIRIPGRTPKPGEQPYVNYMFASPGYFDAVRTPLLRGREFVDTDTLDSMRVAIVNRAMADALWPGENAVGKQVGVGLTKYPVRTVIGVVANVKQSSLREKPAPQMYVPYSQNEIKTWPPMRTMQVALRTAADPAQMTAGVRKSMRSVDPDLPLAKVSTLSALVGRSLTQSRFAMLLLAGFGALALVLASIGMYGVVSHSVTQRTQEIGIRMALGAGRANVFAMVLSRGARLAGAGIAIGLIVALGVTRTMASFLYGVRPADPLTFGAVSLLLGLVALLACYLPARRATRVDPVIAIRHE